MATLTELDKKIKELQAQREELLNKDREKVLEETKANIATYGFTVEQLGFSLPTKKTKGKGKGSVAVKYRNGENEWSGRGRKPKWAQDLSPEALEKFRVEQ